MDPREEGKKKRGRGKVTGWFDTVRISLENGKVRAPKKAKKIKHDLTADFPPKNDGYPLFLGAQQSCTAGFTSKYCSKIRGALRFRIAG